MAPESTPLTAAADGEQAHRTTSLLSEPMASLLAAQAHPRRPSATSSMLDSSRSAQLSTDALRGGSPSRPTLHFMMSCERRAARAAVSRTSRRSGLGPADEPATARPTAPPTAGALTSLTPCSAAARRSPAADLDDPNDAVWSQRRVSHSDFRDGGTQCMVLSAAVAIPAVGGTPAAPRSAWTVPTRRFAMF